MLGLLRVIDIHCQLWQVILCEKRKLVNLAVTTLDRHLLKSLKNDITDLGPSCCSCLRAL